ncbi:MAG: sulfate transporter CysZ [Methylococcales bacterium]|jgi:CysZ protein|nr:sulfate transporter CysZ [Methylococcales bacterium]
MTEIKIDSKKANNPLFVFSCLMRGFSDLRRPEYRKYLIAPLLINMALYLGVFVSGWYYFSGFLTDMIPEWLSWLNWFIWPVFVIGFLIVGVFTFTILANILAAPFYSRLAIEAKQLSGAQGMIEASDNTVWASMLSELKRLSYLGKFAIPLLLLFVIPGLNLLAPMCWVLFAAWALCLEYMAYSFETEGVLFVDQRDQVKRARWGGLMFGGLVMIGMSIPVVNFVVPAAAIIGATIYRADIKAT